MKLAKVAMIQVMSSVEDKQIFSNLNFIKSRIHNQLIEHLALCAHVWAIFLTIQNFPYNEVVRTLYLEKR